MKIRDTITHLTGEERSSLGRIKNILVDNLQPMVIYYFGSTLTTTLSRSCFTTHRKEETHDFRCHILAILPDHIPADKNAAKIATELTQAQVKAHVIVHPLRFVLTHICSDNLFFSWVRRGGIKLYDRGDAEAYLPMPIPKRREWELQADAFFRNAGASMMGYLTEKLQTLPEQGAARTE